MEQITNPVFVPADRGNSDCTSVALVDVGLGQIRIVQSLALSPDQAGLISGDWSALQAFIQRRMLEALQVPEQFFAGFSK